MRTDSAKVLVVDDDRENGELIQEQLSGPTCHVTWFKNPQLALQQFRKGAYQVGILDLRMPHMNGVDLFEKLREKDPDIGIIMLTAYPSVDSVLKTLKTGAYDYLKKPYQMDELQAVVRRLLEKKGYFSNLETSVNRHVGNRIKGYRQERGWTIARLASHAQLSKSLISQIENAKNSASLVSLSRIARSLRVRASDILQDI